MQTYAESVIVHFIVASHAEDAILHVMGLVSGSSVTYSRFRDHIMTKMFWIPVDYILLNPILVWNWCNSSARKVMVITQSNGTMKLIEEKELIAIIIIQRSYKIEEKGVQCIIRHSIIPTWKKLHKNVWKTGLKSNVEILWKKVTKMIEMWVI